MYGAASLFGPARTTPSSGILSKGTIDYFPGSGDSQKPANIMQIKDGKFVWIANVEP